MVNGENIPNELSAYVDVNSITDLLISFGFDSSPKSTVLFRS